jgi:hypothetical protein
MLHNAIPEQTMHESKLCVLTSGDYHLNTQPWLMQLKMISSPSPTLLTACCRFGVMSLTAGSLWLRHKYGCIESHLTWTRTRSSWPPSPERPSGWFPHCGAGRRRRRQPLQRVKGGRGLHKCKFLFSLLFMYTVL